MTETFLRDAATAPRPAQFADRCKVLRVLHRDGVAQGVEAEVVGANGHLCRLFVRARTVVVACGALNSPTLLLRSSLPNRNKQIGKNLRLHPVQFVTGKVPPSHPAVRVWEGAPMTTVSDECVLGPVGDGYGSKLECPSTHIGLMSSGTDWRGGREFKTELLQLRRVASAIVLTRDRGSGEVRVGKQGNPEVWYPLDAHDRQSLLDGMERGIRALAATGVEEISAGAGTNGFRALPPVDMEEARAVAVDDIVADLRRAGFPLHGSAIASAHQMGTCKMGASAKDSVVDPEGQSWEVQGLFVADTSTFPTSSGTNPMITVLATAHMIAQSIKMRVQQSKL